MNKLVNWEIKGNCVDSKHVVTKISPIAAAAICINTIIGGGLFINPNPLTTFAGPLGFGGYVLATIFLIPLLLSVAHLAKRNSVSGGLYVYSKLYVHPFAGFLSGWGYFIGKTTSAAILMHSFVLFLQKSVPAIAHFSTLGLDCFFIMMVVMMNIMGVRTGGMIQWLFAALKFFPLFSGLFLGFSAFDPSHLVVTMQDVVGLPYTIPIAVFASLGFEIICAIGHMIENPEKNVKPVIMRTYLFSMLMNVLFQFFLFGALGRGLVGSKFPLLSLASLWPASYSFFFSLINSCVFTAIIGSCFSIFTSNCWNLFTLADNGHLPLASLLTKVNKNHVPWVSLLLQGLLACLILFLNTNQIPLQNMAIFGQIVAYTFTSMAAYRAACWGVLTDLSPIIPLCGLLSCSGILVLSLVKMIQSGVSVSFLLLFLLGIVSFVLRKYMNSSE